jgi:deoxycytidine triphosphate deaminase
MLSDVEIEDRINKRSLILDPFSSDSLNGAGYDLRLGMDAVLPPRKHRLVVTLERVELPDDLAGILHVRSSLAREGIIASVALIDPGFRGQLTISLFNSSDRSLEMKKGDRFMQVSLLSLGTKSRRPYRGRYQDSQGIVERRL